MADPVYRTHRRPLRLLSVSEATKGRDALAAAPIALSVVEHNFREIATMMSPLGGARRKVETLAILLGGVYAEVDLSPDIDTLVKHDLAEVPSTILIGIDTGGLDGVVTGHPQAGAAPLNERPWTATEVWLRATRAARYAVVIL